ncbi:hypothetical protein C9374_006502 [Naegleria lovaniensis]|uniref:Uncharacterized protein n=1 Tax=Naegleria lovaniensis TaxID=51637 RepID=A0AA88KJ77_NAELO|nr:uncharacterized protein C9374_006502 [Naegleria lovaniensis]KAG2381513.1 hypothetical protein C9374_006502 [Naegleria lovaniensis]
MASFDSLVSSLILQFSHHSEWRRLQPFLISKTFYSCFHSESFARDYLRNVFSLNERQLEKLNHVMNVANRCFALDDDEELTLVPKTKKRKYSKKTSKETKKPQAHTYWLILETFVELHNRDHVKQMNQNLTSYDFFMNTFPKSVPSSQHLESKEVKHRLNKIETLLQIEQQQVELLESMNKFFTQPQNIEDIIISPIVVNKLFGKLKGVYVTGVDIADSDNKTLDYVVFSDCGFPFSFSTASSHDFDSEYSNHDYRETVLVNSCEFFSNSLFRNDRGLVETECSSNHDSKMLALVKTVLLDTEKFTREERKSLFRNKEQPESSIGFERGVTTLLYEWLLLGVLSPVDAGYYENARDFFPFCLSFEEDDDDFEHDSAVNNEEGMDEY